MNSVEFLAKVKAAFNQELPGNKAHEIMSPINRPIDISSISNIHEYKKSAIALICYPKENELVFILIQRPTYEGNHSGQISFPGGKKEEKDPDLEFTARRETFEEVGIQLLESHLIGKLTNVFIPVSKFIIEPYVYYLDNSPLLIPDSREVHSIFTPTISDLTNDANVSSTSITLSMGQKLKNVPYFDLQEKEVWGATALILSEFKELLKSTGTF